MAKTPERPTIRSALETLLATILDHQGCIIPPHLVAACEREANAAVAEDKYERSKRYNPKG